jgi:hypothetical protein
MAVTVAPTQSIQLVLAIFRLSGKTSILSLCLGESSSCLTYFKAEQRAL